MLINPNCPFCNKEYKSQNSLTQHSIRCTKNKKRIINKTPFKDKSYKENSKINIKRNKRKEEALIKKLGNIIVKKKICVRCSVEWTYKEREYKDNEKKFCSYKCSNSRTLTKEIKNKISKKLKGGEGVCIKRVYEPGESGARGLTGERCNIRYCIICKKVYANLRKKNPKVCGNISCKKILQEKQNHQNHLRGISSKRLAGGFPQNYTRSKSFKYKTVQGNIIILQSSYELIVAKDLDKNNIKWIRPKFLWWTDSKDRKHRYFPDFYLIDYDVYLDPKNDYLIKKDKDKIERVIKQNNVKTLILDKNNLKWPNIFRLLNQKNL